MAEDHDDSGQARRSSRTRLAVTLAMSGGYMIAEFVGGLLTNSLALLADAGHMLSDVAALALSLFAFWIAERRPTARSTYGYYRAEILAALVNGAMLIAIAILIFIEAFDRLRRPQHVAGGTMMFIAIGGLLVNLISLRILRRGKEQSLNVHGAWLHVLTDALGSVGAIIAAVLIWSMGWYWADPVTSALIGLLVVYSSWQLLAETVAVLMESAPRGVDVDRVREALGRLPGVLEVHDLHVWTITSGMISLSAHLVTDHEKPHQTLLGAARRTLHDQFGISHITLQIEPEDFGEMEMSI